MASTSSGHTVAPRLALETAALLACGPRAVLSHRTAAALWELFPYPAKERVCVTVPPGHGAARPNLRIHRTVLDPRDVRRRDGLAVTSPPRTILDLSAELADDDLERIVAEAHYRRLASERELIAQLERNPRKRGARRLRRVLDLPGGPRRTRSPAERAAAPPAARQRRHGLRMQRPDLRLRGRLSLARPAFRRGGGRLRRPFRPRRLRA